MIDVFVLRDEVGGEEYGEVVQFVDVEFAEEEVAAIALGIGAAELGEVGHGLFHHIVVDLVRYGGELSFGIEIIAGHHAGASLLVCYGAEVGRFSDLDGAFVRGAVFVGIGAVGSVVDLRIAARRGDGHRGRVGKRSRTTDLRR